MTLEYITRVDPALLVGKLGARTMYASRHGVTLDSNVVSGGGTDATAGIQALLDVALDGLPLEVVIDGAALISDRLSCYSNTTIRCPNQYCGLYLDDGSDISLLRNGNPSPSWPAQTFTADAGTDIITANDHKFVDEMPVQVSTTTTLPAPLVAATTYYVRDKTTHTFKLAATKGGAAIDITSTGSGTHSVISVIVDKRITLIGGTYNGNGPNQTGIGSFNTQEADGTLLGLIQMYGVEGLKIHNVTCVHSKTIAVHLANVQNFDIRDIFFDQSSSVQQGGLQLEGLCSSGNINGLRGSTWDDALAFSSDGANWPNPPFVGLGPYVPAGDVTDITASNISMTSAWSAVRLFNGVNRIDRIRVSNITGSYIWLVSNDGSVMDLTGNIGTVSIEGAVVTHRDEAQPLISLGGKIEHLILRDIHVNDPPNSQPLLKVFQGANIKLLDIDGFSVYDTTIDAYPLIPIIIEGRIHKFLARNCKWIRSVTLPNNISTTDAFIVIQTTTGAVQDLILDGLVVNYGSYGVYELAGYMRTAKLSNIHIEHSIGGAALRVTGDDLVDFSINNWYGEMSPPFFSFSANPRKRGDVFPFETTVPTFTSATVKGGQDVVTVVFSEAVNAINAILGVTIKKNTVTQTISAATRSVVSDNAIDFQLSANVAPGDTVTWEYAVASGFITDWRGNALANVAAQAVTNANTTRTFDRFNGAEGDPLNARTPSPTTTGGNNWATLRGTSALQTIPQNTTMAELASPFEAAGATTVINSSVQSLVVNSTFADCIVTCDVMMSEVNGAAGIVFRCTDSDNFWIFWITPYVTGLFKVVAGAVTTVSSVSNFHGLEIFYKLEVTLSGNGITGKVNGAETASTTDAFNNTATKHGIEGSQGNNYFDNFLVVS